MNTCIEVLKLAIGKKMARDGCLDITEDITEEKEIQEHLKSCERCRALVEALNKGDIQQPTC